MGSDNKKSVSSKDRYLQQNDEDDDEVEFEKLLCKEEKIQTNDDQNEDNDEEFRKYMDANDEDEERSNNQGQGLSMDDLKITLDEVSLKQNEARVISKKEDEVPEFHAQFYWKVSLDENKELDELLKDYE